MLPKIYRLRLKNDFDRVFKQGRFIGGKFFTLGYAENKLDFSRFAVITPKKVSKKAVQRNLVRRRAVEAIRLGREKIKGGFDLAFVSKPAARGKEYHEMEEDIKNLLKRGGFIS